MMKADLYDEDYNTVWTIVKYGTASKYSTPQKNVVAKSFESKKAFR